jgi:hypothetical protein
MNRPEPVRYPAQTTGNASAQLQSRTTDACFTLARAAATIEWIFAAPQGF